MKGTCPLADTEVPPVCLQVPHSRSVFTTEGSHEKKHSDASERCYTIDPTTDFNIVLTKLEGSESGKEIVEAEVPMLYAERSFNGYGQQHGGVQAILTNPGDEEVEFVYTESLPWFMRIYLHTLSTRISTMNSASITASKVSSDIVKEIYYRPAVDRTRGTQLELLLQIPPKSTVFLTYDFEKAILRYTEYPPDANRGFDVAAAVISTRSPRVMNLRTTSLLLYLPTPDFSMPYNVIIFTSTAIALSFGGLYNIIIRRFVGADEGPKSPLRARIQGLVQRVKGLITKKAS
jgi:phosphatidylinositol glycan class T